MSGRVYPLHGSQKEAVQPRESVWLSASAGTGKTQVLSARVLRLLLEENADPSSILCLTFTKAGAAEMAVRVSEVLARWVRMDDVTLQEELRHVGAAIDPETRERARSLFARVLDCPGGGLRIDTIHAFAQWLLSAFPGEAGLLPGARAMDDRERALLMDEVMARLLSEAEPSEIAAIREMSLRKGPEGVRAWLGRCADAVDLFVGPAGWQPPMHGRVCRLLGIPSDPGTEWLANLCSDREINLPAVHHLLTAYGGWNAASGKAAVSAIEIWLAAGDAQRLASIDDFATALFFKNGNPRLPKNADQAFQEASARVGEILTAIRSAQSLAELARFLTPQLEVGRRFALMWTEAKLQEGLVDFDDLIRKAAALLSQQAMSDWIRYKLDRRFDHILIDEAQDTNAAQWAIINALTDDFFSGEGARGRNIRTIFTVGDTKQAIFGFQGTSPENFIAARDQFSQRIAGLAQSPDSVRDRLAPAPLLDLDLGRSFRTADPILRFVDRAIEAIGPGEFGLDRAPPPHIGEDRPGIVAIWNLVVDGLGVDDADAGDAGWLSRHDRQLADRIARQVRAWMDEGLPLVKGEKPGEARRATPGDVMVLVRKRRELASLIVARLYAHGVPVAGVDRLRLGAPLAVKDLMSAIRFAVQPLDDLNLASLLVSPLGGWSQEDLLTHGYRPRNVRLWDHLRQASDPPVIDTIATLREILRRADFDSSQALLHWILTGPMDGRRKLVSRLGREANDPIDELLNAANTFASAHVVSLQGFIRWFDAGEGELKREAGIERDQVRVLTVHGSKGLQAPIVILADAAIGPDTPDSLSISETDPSGTSSKTVPVPDLPQDQRVGPVSQAFEKAAQESLKEHWRLLYVAMTRAEEALFIGGSLGPRDVKRGTAPDDSWYARLKPLMETGPVEDPIWGSRQEWGALSTLKAPRRSPSEVDEADVPDWLEQRTPEEPRPPRPLAPSGAGENDAEAVSVPPANAVQAARRGTLIHALLERLPSVPSSERRRLGEVWLARNATDFSESERREFLEKTLAVTDDPEFADVFAPGSMAEVSIAAVVSGQVISGTLDRLLVTHDRIMVVDFKTTRFPPTSHDQIPISILRQMAAYVAALEKIHSEKAVTAAVVYTQTPQLIPLSRDFLADHIAGIGKAKELPEGPPVD
ncbi:double-strand break repair helicase AddA [Qipengyuania sp.]|uniref:double-strand break repair helicase AddA n=1 Tax=Qipengyuania sp. TaxID=2004515 RepID=UPI0035C79776